MTAPLYSVAQVAEMLGLHVKTVRRYVREGRLAAHRIGKEYRIAAGDLERFAGIKPAAGGAAHAETSLVIDIDAVDRDAAQHLVNGLLGLGGARRGGGGFRLDTRYDEARQRLRIMAMAGLDEAETLLAMVRHHVARIGGDGA